MIMTQRALEELTCAPEDEERPLPSITKNELRVLSWNVWDVPVSRDRHARVRAICSLLEHNDDDSTQLKPSSETAEEYQKSPPWGQKLDIIGLQEAFMPPDRNAFIRAAAKGGLTYWHYFMQGVSPPQSNSSGLLILSRFPIEEVAFWRYSVNGKPHKIQHFDHFCGKGCGLARIRVPNIGLVDVYLSHFVSFYVDHPSKDEYIAHRVAQAYECARWMRMTQRSSLALLLTDLNSPSDSLTYRVLTSYGLVNDSYLQICEERQRLKDATKQSRERKSQPVATFARKDNPYTPSGELAQRIDYIFWRVVMPTSEPKKSAALPWTVTFAEAIYRDPVVPPLPEKHKHKTNKQNSKSRKKVYMSDHLAVVAVFSWDGSRELASVDNGNHRSAAMDGMVVAAPDSTPGQLTRSQTDTLALAANLIEWGIRDCLRRKRNHERRAILAFALITGGPAILWFREMSTLPIVPLLVLFCLLTAFWAFCELFLAKIFCNEEHMALRMTRLTMAVDLKETLSLGKRGEIEPWYSTDTLGHISEFSY